MPASRNQSPQFSVVDVPPAYVDLVPRQAVAWLKAALDRPPVSCETPEYYLTKVKNHEANLWLIYLGQEMVAAMVVMVLLRPKGRVLLIGPLGGKKIKQWAASIFEFCEQFALNNDCIGMTCHTRKGMAKLFPRAISEKIVLSYEVKRT